MSTPYAERVELGQAFKLFPNGVKEVRLPSYVRFTRASGPALQLPEYHGVQKILSAPPLPDLLFRVVLGHSSEAQTSRDRLRLWIEADQDFLIRSGLILQRGMLRALDQSSLPTIGQLAVHLIKLGHGQYEAQPDETLLRREIKFSSFVQMTADSEKGPYVTANPHDPEELSLFAARFTTPKELQSLMSQADNPK